MNACISTHFDCTKEKLWPKIIEPKSLQFVTYPILNFSPATKGELDEEWILGKTYELKLYFLNILPIGRHNIKILTIDKKSNRIVSHESGTLAKIWNHTIRFHQAEKNKLSYTDEIRIEAGWLTLPLWLFAHFFYRYRQRRWKILLS